MHWRPEALAWPRACVRWLRRFPQRVSHRLRVLALMGTVVISERLWQWLPAPRRNLRSPPLEWGRGVSIVIPERGGVDLLQDCLRALFTAIGAIDEPAEVIVVVNGSPRQDYQPLQQTYPTVRWLFFEQALGFTRAVLEGVAVARLDSIYLLNNDMSLEPDALRAVLAWRAPRVFAVASQILFTDDGRRREETGWTFMPIINGMPAPYHAESTSAVVRGTVWAGAGSALFHSAKLRELLPGCLPFDPFYWEDADLGVRAWRDGFECLYCPNSLAVHLHRVTIKRYFEATEIERIFERNRLQFQLRNPFPLMPLRPVLDRILALDPRSLQELGNWRACYQLWRTRWQAWRAPERDLDYATMAQGIYLKPLREGPILVVSPFALLPPRHGGALRTQRLATAMAADAPVILLSDEASLYANADPPDYAPFAAVHLVDGRPQLPQAQQRDRIARMANHAHDGLRVALVQLIRRHRPRAVVLEHMELVQLVDLELSPRPPFILNLHDVLLQPDDPEQTAADRCERALMDRFDALLVSSTEDQALLGSRRSVLVPNGCDADLAVDYSPSSGRNILFVGPFRAPINWHGICDFVDHVYPELEARVADVSLTIVGGPGAIERCADQPGFARLSIRVLETVDSMRALLSQATLTINPQAQLRGSSLKVLESLAAGRVCVSTEAGARGHRELGLSGLKICATLADFADALTDLLLDDARRIALERPDSTILAGCDWSRCAEPLRALLRELGGQRFENGHDDSFAIP